MFKQVKEWIRNGLSISTFKSCMNEKRSSVDNEWKEFIRPKRSINNLPDSWNTQWIRRPKRSWKEKSKNKHQYDKIHHTLKEKTNNFGKLRDQFEEDELIFLLKTKYKDKWYYFNFELDKNGKIDVNKLYNVCFNDHWYSVAERLLAKKKIKAKLYTHTWEFNDFGKIKTRSRQFITAIKF